MLVNNFQNLAAAIGGPLLTVMKPALDLLIGFVGMLQDIAATPIGGVLFAAVAGLTGIAGAALLIGAAGARAVGGIIAMQQATNGLLGSVTATRIQLGTLNAQMALQPTMFGKAATAARGLGAALSTALGPIGLIVTGFAVLPGVISGVRDALADMTGTTQNARQQIASFGEDSNAAFVQGLTEMSAGAARFSADIQLPIYAANGTLRSLDATIAELAQSGNPQEAIKLYNDLIQTWERGGGNVDALNAYMKDSIPALEGIAGGARTATGAFQEMSDAEEASIKKLEELQTTITDGALKFVETKELIEQTTAAQTQAAKQLAIDEGASAEEAETAWNKLLRRSYHQPRNLPRAASAGRGCAEFMARQPRHPRRPWRVCGNSRGPCQAWSRG